MRTLIAVALILAVQLVCTAGINSNDVKRVKRAPEARISTVEAVSVLLEQPISEMEPITPIPPTAQDDTIQALIPVEGIEPARLDSVLALARAERIPPKRINDILSLAELSGMGAAKVVTILEMASANGVPLSRIIEILEVSIAESVIISKIEEILSIDKSSGISMSDALDILAISLVAKIKASQAVEILSMALQSGLKAGDISNIIAIGKAHAVDAVSVTQIYTLLLNKEITEGKLVEIALQAEKDKIPMPALKDIVALVYRNANVSRFDILDPVMFSTLWNIKRKAKAMENKGENTDKLWKRYWEIFQRSALTE